MCLRTWGFESLYGHHALVMELVDIADLKFAGIDKPCGFESHLAHQNERKKMSTKTDDIWLDMVTRDAFPQTSEVSLGSGLSKLEYYASAAMQGILANTDCDWTPDVTASVAVDHAEALLSELQARKRS